MKILNSLYIHFPFCRHLCNYCDFYKTIPKDRSEINSFHKWFEASFDKHQDLMTANSFEWGNLETLYIGGGTPSLWGVEGAIFLRDFLKNKGIKIGEDLEFTLEVNPGSWTEESLEEWKKTGVNRYSLGIQALDGRFIKHLDRVHSIEDTFATLEYFKNKKYNFSVDFMLGIPFSEELDRDVISELEKVLTYNPNHISLYILTTKDNYIHKDNLPSEERIEKEYLAVSEYLTQRGFLHYEVSNYAKPGMESKHNLKYWKGESVGAIGPSATGFLSLGKEGIRYKWQTKSPEFILENIGLEEYKLERLYTLLRTNEGISGSDFFEDQNKWETLVEKWSDSGYLSKKEEKIRLSAKGYLLMDSLMDDIFLNFKNL
jgi:oxygen-independent coproporphyrinogen III oxidase